MEKKPEKKSVERVTRATSSETFSGKISISQQR
jgi:hypothetical protein